MAVMALSSTCRSVIYWSLLVYLVQQGIWGWKIRPFRIACFHFEVFGDVQNVHFKECTKRVAEEYNCRGYVVYTKNNSVRGYIEGHENFIPYMKKWLQERGSPQSTIDKVVFYNERYINDFRYKVFHSLLLDFRDTETHQEPHV